MAKSKKSTESHNAYRVKPVKTNKGIHSKNNQSKNKKSKHYKKVYVGQGR